MIQVHIGSCKINQVHNIASCEVNMVHFGSCEVNCVHIASYEINHIGPYKKQATHKEHVY